LAVAFPPFSQRRVVSFPAAVEDARVFREWAGVAVRSVDIPPRVRRRMADGTVSAVARRAMPPGAWPVDVS
jgi:hypothetical protein